MGSIKEAANAAILKARQATKAARLAARDASIPRCMVDSSREAAADLWMRAAEACRQAGMDTQAKRCRHEAEALRVSLASLAKRIKGAFMAHTGSPTPRGSRAWFADRAGVTRRTVYRYLSGEIAFQGPIAALLEALESAAGITEGDG